MIYIHNSVDLLSNFIVKIPPLLLLPLCEFFKCKIGGFCGQLCNSHTIPKEYCHEQPYLYVFIIFMPVCMFVCICVCALHCFLLWLQWVKQTTKKYHSESLLGKALHLKQAFFFLFSCFAVVKKKRKKKKVVGLLQLKL